jgi:hypothetical protein
MTEAQQEAARVLAEITARDARPGRAMTAWSGGHVPSRFGGGRLGR